MDIKDIKNIFIGAINYKITEVEGLASNHNALGRQCGNMAAIEIDINIPEKVKRKVLFHEILEAINYEFELNLEHEKITILESSILGCIKQNKEAFSLIIEEDI